VEKQVRNLRGREAGEKRKDWQKTNKARVVTTDKRTKEGGKKNSCLREYLTHSVYRLDSGGRNLRRLNAGRYTELGIRGGRKGSEREGKAKEETKAGSCCKTTGINGRAEVSCPTETARGALVAGQNRKTKKG